jgi:Alpha amylase, catalytic domain
LGRPTSPIDRLMAYYGADLTGFHLPFNFHLISTDWKPKPVASLIEAYEAALPVGAWPNWVLGNHDRSRVASRVGRAQARVAVMLLLTLRGTPTIYQGEEIGMVDTPIPHLLDSFSNVFPSDRRKKPLSGRIIPVIEGCQCLPERINRCPVEFYRNGRVTNFMVSAALPGRGVFLRLNRRLSGLSNYRLRLAFIPGAGSEGALSRRRVHCSHRSHRL